MIFKETMAWLKKNGTAQNIKVYKCHGAADNVFEVSFANLNHLVKKIKINHELLLSLWETGNAEAQTFALKIISQKRWPING